MFPELEKNNIIDANNKKTDEEVNVIKNIHWSLNSDDALYFINDDNIYQLNLLDYSVKRIVQKENNPDFKIIDFCINGQKIYLIRSKNDKFILEEWSKNKDEKILLLDNISPGFKFVPCPKPYATLLDKKDNRLMIINIETQEIILEDSAKNVNWSKKLNENNYKISYNNDFEIHTYDTNSNNKKLITRHSQAINSTSWIADYSHIAFIYDNSINITNLDEKNKVIQTLFKGGEIKNIIASYDKNKLYFKGKIGEQEGLFELDIL